MLGLEGGGDLALRISARPSWALSVSFHQDDALETSGTPTALLWYLSRARPCKIVHRSKRSSDVV